MTLAFRGEQIRLNKQIDIVIKIVTSILPKGKGGYS